MDKIVSITHHSSGPRQALPEPADSALGNRRGGLSTGQDTRPRGILLEFPKSIQGPLYAAGMMALAMLASAAPSFHI